MTMSRSAVRVHPSDPFQGPGEMRALCRSMDWGATPLGAVHKWPIALRTTVATLLASRHPMFLFWGPELVQLYNDAYRASLGAGGRHPKALGMRGAEFWTEIWHIIGPQIDQVLSTGEATWHEDHLVPILRNGRIEEVYWTYSYGPAFDDDGGVAGVLVVCQETTAHVLTRREHQQLLADAERAWRVAESERDRASSILENMTDAHFTLDADFRFVSANRAMEQGVGMPRDALIGRSIWECFPSSSGTPFERYYRQVAREGTAVHFTHDYRDSRLDLVAEVDAYPTLAGGVAVFWRDVTARVRTEQMLASAARRNAFRVAIADVLRQTDAPESVESTVTRMLGEHLEASRVHYGVVDGEETAIIDADFAQGVPALHGRFRLADFGCRLVAELRGGGAVVVEDVEADSRLDDGGRAACRALGVRAAVSVPLVRQGRLVALLAVHSAEPRRWLPDEVALIEETAQRAWDAVTRAQAERARLESEARTQALFASMEAARRDAESANRSKSEFLAVMSHELRTPLNAIAGYTDLLELGIHGPVTPAQREALQRIRQSEQHLLALVNGVLNYARLESGRLHYDIADIRLAEALASCAALVAPQMKERGLRFERQCPAAPEVIVRGDAVKLQQIMLNLLSNAFKFTPRGGSVTLGCDVDDDVAHVRVRDTGRGIAQAQLARIFEPFVQVDTRLTRANDGMGLGLAISRDLARGMSGELTVESEEGVGSTFSLTLPRSR